ncbi:MAG: ABC transporter ATP-binding protein [Micrococcales bacterium]|nr:ABC transporter ATP-binding protein [Micrococcales bacterium]
MACVNAVEIADLTVSYTGRRAVDELSLTVPAGTTCVVLGPNGAGKTTTLSVLLGLRGPDSGTVSVLGSAPHDPAQRSRIGVVLQDGGLPVAATPAAIVKHFASLYADPLPLPSLVERLGLADLDRPYRRLSGGEQQRVKIAVALVGRPRLLIMDEPTTGMDPAARRVFWTLLDEIRDQGVTTLLTTHQPDEVSTRADQIVVIHQGTVIANAPPAALIGSAPVWFTCARHLDLSSLRAVLGEGYDVAEVEPGRYRVNGDVGVAQISAINSWVAGHGDGNGEVTVVRTLEEAYLEMTGGVAW